MNFPQFQKMVSTMDKIHQRSHDVHKLGVNLLEYDDPHFEVITALVLAHFGKEAADWFSWFCYEKDFGRNQNIKAHEKDGGREICRNVRELWKLMEDGRNRER